MLEPLSSVLARQTPGTLERARSIIQPCDRERLIGMYRNAFATQQRTKAFLLAEALTIHRLPPCLRFAHPPPVRPLTVDQQLDLFAHDIQWLAGQHAAQRRAVTGKRYTRLFDEFICPDEFEWVREAEYWFNNGERDQWVIVRGLALSERQQWECKWLRSPVVSRKADALAERRDTVYKAIMLHLPKTSRTMDTDAAKAVLTRRFRVWLCGQMTRDGGRVSPAAAARLYAMWTGDAIDRGTAGKALDWLETNIPESRNRRHGGARSGEIAISNV
ncbi:hypothetical protein [Ralstonia soli]|uniref:Uncharacterized protein n=1 Tax=Ralstonia soli TaxID=2953896 RepID=A0ABT1AIV3_9RALS|nr:hypothetical protein [Ralstonia soli]MCO5398333.1 hypothetical protein [Ralstonia soli]